MIHVTICDARTTKALILNMMSVLSVLCAVCKLTCPKRVESQRSRSSILGNYGEA